MTQPPSQFSSAKPVLVTGATGLVGRAVVARLCRDGVPVRCQVRDLAAFHKLGAVGSPGQIDVRKLDFESASTLDICRLVAGCSAVVHTAALVHHADAPYREYELLNVRTTQQLAEGASAAGVDTFLFLSTIAVLGQGPLEMAREEEPLRPVTPYAVSKAESERWLNSFDGFRRCVILRPPLVFGEGDRGNLIRLIRQIKRGRYFHVGGGRTSKSLIYAGDLAAAIALCLTRSGAGHSLFHVANPQPVELRALTGLIARLLGRGNGFVTLPSTLVVAGAKVAERLFKEKSPVTVEQLDRLTTTTTCSADKLMAATGFVPRFSLEEALSAEIAWANRAGVL